MTANENIESKIGQLDKEGNISLFNNKIDKWRTSVEKSIPFYISFLAKL